MTGRDYRCVGEELAALYLRVQPGMGAQPQAPGSGGRLKMLSIKLATSNSPSTVKGLEHRDIHGINCWGVKAGGGLFI